MSGERVEGSADVRLGQLLEVALEVEPIAQLVEQHQADALPVLLKGLAGFFKERLVANEQGDE